MRASRLIKSAQVSLSSTSLKDFQVCGIACDSKQVLDNFIFVAIRGAKANGNAFVDEAIQRGAKAIVTDDPKFKTKNSNGVSFIVVNDARLALSRIASQFYGCPSLKLKVVGITGTNGKTTISYLLEALLREAGLSPSVIGTVNYRFNNKIMPSKNTTPGPVELECMLSSMLKEGIDYCIMEVSSHALDQARTGQIDFHSAIFTNLTQDHLDYHKTLKNYFQVKSRLFKNLSKNAFAVINNDDKYSQRLKKITPAKVITYGIERDAAVMAKNIKSSISHTEFLALTPGGKISIKTRLIGEHNVYNILAVIAWAMQEGIGAPVIKGAIERFDLVPGRLERIDFKGGFSVFVDYAHTQDALKNILNTLRQICKRRIIVVFGCGGERDKTKRPKMGKTVTELADYAIITSDNPRSEDPLAIINDIKRGINKNNYCVIEDRLEAIKKSLKMAGPRDIVLIAGKGHEEYQILRNSRVHFSDKETVRECLKLLNC